MYTYIYYITIAIHQQARDQLFIYFGSIFIAYIT